MNTGESQSIYLPGLPEQNRNAIDSISISTHAMERFSSWHENIALADAEAKIRERLYTVRLDKGYTAEKDDFSLHYRDQIETQYVYVVKRRNEKNGKPAQYVIATMLNTNEVSFKSQQRKHKYRSG